MTACLGLLLMIITNKIRLPVILSRLLLEPTALGRTDGVTGLHQRWWAISVLAQPRPALATLAVVGLFAIFMDMALRHSFESEDAIVMEAQADSNRHRRTRSKVCVAADKERR